MTNVTVSYEMRRRPRWYFGGLASGIAAAITHPLDLVKVHMQTVGSTGGFFTVGSRVVRQEGVLALYTGLTASLLRQATYSLPRFGLYEMYKNFAGKHSITFLEQLSVAGVAGFVGGVCGQPADLVNVRMQNDVKKPKAERRGYRWAGDGLVRIVREEGGLRALYPGVSMMAIRAGLMTVGQAVGYDQCKDLLLSTGLVGDVPSTHVMAGVGASASAVLLTQPFDVIKTRLQNSPPGRYSGLGAVIKELLSGDANPAATAGPGAAPLSASPAQSSRPSLLRLGVFFKGLSPAFIRIGPHTVLIFIFKEQLTIYFGSLDKKA